MTLWLSNRRIATQDGLNQGGEQRQLSQLTRLTILVAAALGILIALFAISEPSYSVPPAGVALELVPRESDVNLSKEQYAATSGRVRTGFRIVNNGTRLAVIGRVQTSCSCARPTLSTTRIPPGGHVEVKVDVTANSDSSNQYRVSVYFEVPKGFVLEFPGQVTIH